MASLTETSVWEPGIYQLETTDNMLGGPPNPLTKQGIDNVPLQQLANRTIWLRDELETLYTKAQVDALVDAADTLDPGAVLDAILQLDGSGSGLDADRLDGHEATYFGRRIPGQVSHFAGETPPDGWLERDGSSLSRTAYSALFNAIGTRFGSIDGTSFNLPDDRGNFDRGWDNGRGRDTGRLFGSEQAATRVLRDWLSLATGRDAIVDGGLQTAAADWEVGTDELTYSQFEAVHGSSVTGDAQVDTYGMRVRPVNRAYLPIIQY